MSTEVIIKKIGVVDTIIIVESLRKKGYASTVDFDFSYHPKKNNEASHTVFTFYNDMFASWFVLEFGSWL